MSLVFLYKVLIGWLYYTETNEIWVDIIDIKDKEVLEKFKSFNIWSGIVDDVRTYFESSTNLFYIPSLSADVAKIN